jgi:hypothetical protein
MHGTNVQITAALFVVSGFGVSGVDISDMTAIVIFGLISCALIGDSVGTVMAFLGKLVCFRCRIIIFIITTIIITGSTALGGPRPS